MMAAKSADQMDNERRENIAYEYLCRLEEARKWISACIRRDLPFSGTELEDQLTHGVYLALLGNAFAPNVVPIKKIFDVELTR